MDKAKIMRMYSPSRSSLAALQVLLCCLFAVKAQAVDYSIAVGQTLEALSVTAADTVRLQSFNDRSYCCTTNSEVTSSGAGFTGIQNLTQSGTDSLKVFRSTQGGTIDRGERWCHFQDDLIGPTLLIYDIELFGSAPFSASIRCVETTLVGGFNTSVTDFNFLEISAQGINTILTDIEGKVIITTVVNPQTIVVPFTIDFNTSLQPRLDISIHDAIGNVNDFGQITIIHNGADDMLNAKLTQYRTVTLNPFDFEPVLQEVFVKRAERW